MSLTSSGLTVQLDPLLPLLDSSCVTLGLLHESLRSTVVSGEVRHQPAVRCVHGRRVGFEEVRQLPVVCLSVRRRHMTFSHRHCSLSLQVRPVLHGHGAEGLRLEDGAARGRSRRCNAVPAGPELPLKITSVLQNYHFYDLLILF